MQKLALLLLAQPIPLELKPADFYLLVSYKQTPCISEKIRESYLQNKIRVIYSTNCSDSKFSGRQVWANSVDQDPDQCLYCLPFQWHLFDTLLYGKITIILG